MSLGALLKRREQDYAPHTLRLAPHKPICGIVLCQGKNKGLSS